LRRCRGRDPSDACNFAYRLTVETILIAAGYDCDQGCGCQRLFIMKNLHILIVEDKPLIAMVLKTIIENVVSATFVREASVAATKDALHEDIDFAFLDFDVTNGKIFEIARILQIKRVRYVFVSASRQDELPLELRNSPFISKPFQPSQIERVLQSIEA
jgi:CheY-like chemotaxis protein